LRPIREFTPNTSPILPASWPLTTPSPSSRKPTGLRSGRIIRSSTDLWFQYQQTKEQRDKTVLALQQKVTERNSNAQRETAKRLEEARAALARDINDWSPDLAGKLNQFAVSLGFTPEEVGQVTDPRIVKLLHAAWAGNQAKVTQAAARKAASVESAKPLSTVGGASPTRVKATETASDKLSTDEWLKRRNVEIKHKRGR
jgi:hypothetical protein